MKLSKKSIAKYTAIISIVLLISLCVRININVTEVHRKVYHTTYIVKAGLPHSGLTLHIDLSGWLKFYEGNRLAFITELGSAMTDIGKNLTMAKISGNTSIALISDYLYNLTYIALGTDVGLTTSSTVLPNEWNRTLANQEILNNGHTINLTATIYPSGSGSTNATSVNWKSGIATDNSMWCYDTFATKTYTSEDHFEIEWQIQITYS